MTTTNPNGANQYQLDPRQKLCWDSYINPKSETWSNAYKSAIKAGYEESTALQITTEKWFTEKVRRMNMLGKAERVLDDTLETEHVVKKIGMFGPIKDPETKEVIYEVDTGILKIKQDTAKFLAERLGKDEGYSQRTENTGKDGTPLVPESNSSADIAEIAKRVGEELKKEKSNEKKTSAD